MTTLTNLLTQALSILPKSAFQVQHYSGSTVNDLGIRINTYGDAVAVVGMIQPVRNDKYQMFNLEFGKNYVEVWSTETINGLDVQQVSDKVLFGGKTFSVVKRVSWTAYNGWNSVIAVEEKTA